MNKPFKTPNGWRVDYRRARAGEKPFRVQRVFNTNGEAEAFSRQLDERVQQALDGGTSLGFAQILAKIVHGLHNQRLWQQNGNSL